MRLGPTRPSHAGHHDARPRRSRGRFPTKILAVIVAGLCLQGAVVASFSSVLDHPTVRNATVDVSSAGPAWLPQLPGVSYTIVGSAAQARADVKGDLVSGALVSETSGDELYLDPAGSALLAAALSNEFTGAAQAAGHRLQIVEVHPAPAKDSNGLASYLAVLGLVLGGYIGFTLLSRVLSGFGSSVRANLRALLWMLIYSAVSSSIIVMLVDPVLHVLTGAPGAMLAAGTLVSFAVVSYTAALVSLFRGAGIVIAVGTLVILGSPTAGGSVPAAMMAGGWRFLAGILPNNAGVSLLRSVVYFNGTGVGRPLTVLSIYAAVGVLVVMLTGWRSSRTASAPVVAGARPDEPALVTEDAGATVTS